MKIQTERLILRDLKKTDVKDLHVNVNNVKIAQYIPVIAHPYLRKHAVGFVTHCIKESEKKPRLNYEFGICLKSDNKLIGMISLTNIDRFKGTCTLGYWLGEKYWRQGIVYEAVKKMTDFAFKVIKIRRINIEAFGGNLASNELIKKAGFIYEGTLRKSHRDIATKKVHDEVKYGMLREEWLKEK